MTMKREVRASFQISGPRISVIHGGNKTGRLVNRDPAVAGNVDHPAKVQDRVEYSQSLVSGHVDLIQDTEAPLGGAFVYRAGTEYHLPLPEGVGTYTYIYWRRPC